MDSQIPLYLGIPLAVLCACISAAFIAFFIFIIRNR